MIVSTQIGSAIGRGDVNLLVVKGSDFRPQFGASSVERRGIIRWERAVKRGTAAGILAVKLNKYYTLQEALDAIAPNHKIAAKEGRLRHVRRPPSSLTRVLLRASRLVLVRRTGHAPRLLGCPRLGFGRHQCRLGWCHLPRALYRTVGRERGAQRRTLDWVGVAV